MTRQNVLIALLFAATGAALVLAAYEVDRRQKAYLAAHPAHQAPALSGSRDWLERWKRGEPVMDRDGTRVLLVLVAAGAWLRLLLLGWAKDPRRKDGFQLRRSGPLDVMLQPRRAPVTIFVMFACVLWAVWMTYYGG